MLSNYWAPAKEASEFLDNQLQPIMGKYLSYIKDLGECIHKIQRMGPIQDNAI